MRLYLVSRFFVRNEESPINVISITIFRSRCALSAVIPDLIFQRFLYREQNYLSWKNGIANSQLQYLPCDRMQWKTVPEIDMYASNAKEKKMNSDGNKHRWQTVSFLIRRLLACEHERIIIVL